MQMLKQQMFFSRNLRKDRDFPGSTMVKKPRCQSGAQTPSLAGELRSHMPLGAAKKRKEEQYAICRLLAVTIIMGQHQQL